MPQMLIDNARVSAESGATFAVHNPATEEIVDHVPHGAPADAPARDCGGQRGEQALAQGRRPTRRPSCCTKWRVRLREHTERIATLLTLEGGKPLIENRDEMAWSAACLDYYAELQRNTPRPRDPQRRAQPARDGAEGAPTAWWPALFPGTTLSC